MSHVQKVEPLLRELKAARRRRDRRMERHFTERIMALHREAEQRPGETDWDWLARLEGRAPE